MMPRLPVDLADGEIYGEELADLWKALIIELMDEDYIGRRHENRRTYDAGCHGPMCRKAIREHGRRRASTQPSEKYATLDAILEYWYPLAKDRIASVRAQMLSQLTA